MDGLSKKGFMPRKNHDVAGNKGRNRGFEDSDVFKRRSLNSAKMRKRAAKVTSVVLTVLAVIIVVLVAYIYLFE